MNLSPIQSLALASIISADKKKKIRGGVQAGENAVDVCVRIKGTLTISEDSERTPTVSIPYKEVFALFIARAGFTRERSEQLLTECLSDAIAATGKAQGELAAALPQVAETIARVESNILAKLPKTKLQGGCRFAGSVQTVETVTVNPEAIAEAAEAANV